MGADGNIIILDADIVTQHGYNPHNDFISAYRRVIFGRNIWTVYFDTEQFELQQIACDHSIDDYYAIDAVINEWQVWT